MDKKFEIIQGLYAIGWIPKFGPWKELEGEENGVGSYTLEREKCVYADGIFIGVVYEYDYNSSISECEYCFFNYIDVLVQFDKEQPFIKMNEQDLWGEYKW